MQISGSCFCGEVEYEAELDEGMVGICHCRDCQVFSGSAFRLSGIVPPDRFRFTRGTPKHFSSSSSHCPVWIFMSNVREAFDASVT